MRIVHRILLTIALWVLLSGSSFFVSCSSGGDKNDGFLVPNHAPVASNGSFATAANVPISGFLQARDKDDDSLTYAIVSGPRIGFVQLTNSSTGAFTYVSGSAGLDSFEFMANDGLADSNIATVTITVTLVALTWEKIPADSEQYEAPSLEKILRKFGDSGRVSVASAVESAPYFEAFSTLLPVAAIDPFNPGHFLVYTSNDGLQQSIDGGETWNTLEMSAFFVDDNAIATIAFNEFVPGLVYLVIDKPSEGSRLLRSTDGGSTWQLINDSSDWKIVKLVSGPLETDGSIELYVRMEGEKDLFRADDYPY